MILTTITTTHQDHNDEPQQHDMVVIRSWEVTTQQQYQKQSIVESTTPLPTLRFTIGNKETDHHADVGTDLEKAITEHDYIEYLTRNKDFSLNDIKKIAWTERNQEALKKCKINTCRFIGKFTHGWLATAERLNRLDKNHSAQCPRCQSTIDDNEHILTCVEVSGEWRDTAIRAITVTLSKKN